MNLGPGTTSNEPGPRRNGRDAPVPDADDLDRWDRKPSWLTSKASAFFGILTRLLLLGQSFVVLALPSLLLTHCLGARRLRLRPVGAVARVICRRHHRRVADGERRLWGRPGTAFPPLRQHQGVNDGGLAGGELVHLTRHQLDLRQATMLSVGRVRVDRSTLAVALSHAVQEIDRLGDGGVVELREFLGQRLVALGSMALIAGRPPFPPLLLHRTNAVA